MATVFSPESTVVVEVGKQSVRVPLIEFEYDCRFLQTVMERLYCDWTNLISPWSIPHGGKASSVRGRGGIYSSNVRRRHLYGSDHGVLPPLP
jgi:hypothetical protein